MLSKKALAQSYIIEIVIARSEEDSFALLGTGCAISYNKLSLRVTEGSEAISSS